MPSKYQQSARGFSLIEVMITVAIVGILTTVAMWMYSAQVQKSRRTDARTAVLDIAGREERFFSVANNYSQTTTDLGYSGAWGQTVGAGYYTINVVAGVSPPPANAPTFTVTATATGLQLSDTTCASFSDNQLGQQTSVDSGGVDSTATCWN